MQFISVILLTHILFTGLPVGSLGGASLSRDGFNVNACSVSLTAVIQMFQALP